MKISKADRTRCPTVPSDVGTMAEPADALIRCMLENDVKYDPSDEMFFWKAVYYFAGMYAPMHGLSEVAEDGSMTLPRQTVQEFATVLFADYDDLLPPSRRNVRKRRIFGRKRRHIRFMWATEGCRKLL